MTTPPPTDPNELWEAWLAETDEQYRTPQSAMAFAVDRLTSHPAQGKPIPPDTEEELLKSISILMEQCQRQRDALEAVLNWYGNDRLIAFPGKQITEALEAAAQAAPGSEPVAYVPLSKAEADKGEPIWREVFAAKWREKDVWRGFDLKALYFHPASAAPAEAAAEAPQVWEQIGWLRDYDQDGEEITEICSEGDPGAYVVYRGMPPSPSGQNTDDKPGGWKEAFSLYHPDHGLNVSTVQVSREQAQNLIDTHPKDGKWQVVKVEVRIAPMRDTYAILYKPGTPTLPEALAKIKRLTAALTALRDAVKNEPSMQGRRFVGLGIQVNDALGDTPPSSPQSPAARGCICQDQHRRGYCTEPGCESASPTQSGGGQGMTRNQAITKDLMKKMGDDVSRTIMRRIAIAPEPHLPVAMAAAAAAIGILAAVLEKPSGKHDPQANPAPQGVLLAGLLAARCAITPNGDGIAAAYADLKTLIAHPSTDHLDKRG